MPYFLMRILVHVFPSSEKARCEIAQKDAVKQGQIATFFITFRIGKTRAAIMGLAAAANSPATFRFSRRNCFPPSTFFLRGPNFPRRALKMRKKREKKKGRERERGEERGRTTKSGEIVPESGI